MYRNRRFNQGYRLFLTWLILAVLILSACSTNNAELISGDEIELLPETPAVVNCSAACSERGQCGTAVENNNIVVLGGSGPMVADHNRLFPNGTAVTILASSLQTIESLADGSQSSLHFYQIQPQDGQPAGWVAGWCLAAQ